MKAAEPKTSSVATKQISNRPFFSKEAEGNFFGESVNRESSFFKTSSAYSVNGNGALQTKLTIGQPNDKYEQEADSMADKVVQRLATPEPITKKETAVQTKPLAAGITPLIQTKCATCESASAKASAGKEEKLQKKEEEDLVQESPLELQRKPIFESNAEPPYDENIIQRKCAECEKEDSVQKKSVEDSGDTASFSSLEGNLNSSRGNGSPLPEDVRESMESSFDADFSNVRIHNNSSSAELNKNLHAQAFTHGSDIYFNSGKYDTSSTTGKHLLAHELTHVVQQGGVGNNSSVAKKRIQRVSDYYWQPPAHRGSSEHNMIFENINSTNVVIEGPIPNAQIDKNDINSDYGDGKKGYADFYTSTPGKIIIGLFFHSENRPSDLPHRPTKLGGAKYSGERAPVAFPGLRKRTPADKAKGIPAVDKVKEAPKKIWLGEMKPINSIKAEAGVKQLKDYNEGIKLAAGYVNKLSTDGTWNPEVTEMSKEDLKSIIPDKYKYKLNPPKEDIHNCILKGPQVFNRKMTGGKLKEEHLVPARLVVIPDSKRPGIMVYAWVPVYKPTLSDIPPQVAKLDKEVTDYIIKPLKAPIKQKVKGKMGSKKEMPGQKPAIPVIPALKEKIQRKDDEHFDFKTWDKHRKQLIKDFKALKRTDDYKAAVFTGQSMEAYKVIEKHMEIPQPNYIPKERATASGLKSIKFWANPLSVAFGYFKRILGNLFNVVVTGYEKMKGWLKGIANKFKFITGKGGLIGSAFKAIFNILKTVARVIITKVINLLKQDVEKAIETKLNTLLEDAGLDKARAYVDAAMQPIQAAMKSIEAWFAQIIEKYKVYFDEINTYIQGITWTIKIVNKIRWVARAIACASPPLVGCLWSLALEVIERIASWVVETCWFRKKIAPIVLGWNFVKKLSTKLYQLVRRFLKGILPDSVAEFVFPEKDSTPEPAKETDIQCGSGSGGEGDGESAGGEMTPEQEAIMKMQEDLGEDKFLALLDLLKKAKIDGATKMSADRIRQLAEAVKKISADEIKKMADAYVKGDTVKVPADIKEAIKQMANDAKGKPSPIPDFDPAKIEQESTLADAQEDAAETARNLGLKEPTKSEVASSGEPALFLLNLMLNAKSESERLIWLKKGKLVFNQALRDKMIKWKSVAIYDLKIEAHINELKVNIIEVKHDTRSEQQVSMVLGITVISSTNPMIAAGSTDRTVQNVLWNPATQSPTVLQKPDAVKSIVAGIQSNEKGLVDKEYNFSEIGFRAKLTRIKKIDDLAELYFMVTQVDITNAGIYDYATTKYISVKKGTTFMLKENISGDSGSAVLIQPKKIQDRNGLPADIVQKQSIFESDADHQEDEEHIQRKCATCEKEEKLQKNPNLAKASFNSSITESSFATLKSNGSPMPRLTRNQMESSFDADFSEVRIHNDGAATEMNKDLHAEAFTHGSHIYFNAGKFDADSTRGKHLIAHELTHVLQQNGTDINCNSAVQNKKIPDIQTGLFDTAEKMILEQQLLLNMPDRIEKGVDVATFASQFFEQEDIKKGSLVLLRERYTHFYKELAKIDLWLTKKVDLSPQNRELLEKDKRAIISLLSTPVSLNTDIDVTKFTLLEMQQEIDKIRLWLQTADEAALKKNAVLINSLQKLLLLIRMNEDPPVFWGLDQKKMKRYLNVKHPGYGLDTIAFYLYGDTSKAYLIMNTDGSPAPSFITTGHSVSFDENTVPQMTTVAQTAKIQIKTDGSDFDTQGESQGGVTSVVISGKNYTVTSIQLKVLLSSMFNKFRQLYQIELEYLQDQLKVYTDHAGSSNWAVRVYSDTLGGAEFDKEYYVDRIKNGKQYLAKLNEYTEADASPELVTEMERKWSFMKGTGEMIVSDIKQYMNDTISGASTAIKGLEVAKIAGNIAASFVPGLGIVYGGLQDAAQQASGLAIGTQDKWDFKSTRNNLIMGLASFGVGKSIGAIGQAGAKYLPGVASQVTKLANSGVVGKLVTGTTSAIAENVASSPILTHIESLINKGEFASYDDVIGGMKDQFSAQNLILAGGGAALQGKLPEDVHLWGRNTKGHPTLSEAMSGKTTSTTSDKDVTVKEKTVDLGRPTRTEVESKKPEPVEIPKVDIPEPRPADLESPTPGAREHQNPQEIESASIIAEESVYINGEEHRSVVSKDAAGVCSEPCVVINVEYHEELQTSSRLRKRFETIQKLRRQGKYEQAAKKAKKLIMDLEAVRQRKYDQESGLLDEQMERESDLVDEMMNPEPENYLDDDVHDILEEERLHIANAREAGMDALVRHHVFPQTMRRWFERRGFIGDRSIDGFTVALSEGVHQALHGGGDWRRAMRTWDREWVTLVRRNLRDIERAGGRLTYDEIVRIVRILMQAQGIPEEFIHYRTGEQMPPPWDN